MRLLACTYAQHGFAVREILNEAILHSTALYDYRARTAADVEQWFLSKASVGHPILGAINDEDKLVGFATYGAFRAQPAFKYTVEHSVYVDAKHQRKGVGLMLLRQLIQSAMAQNYHVLIAGIDQENLASILLHEKLGFEPAGTIQQAAFKFGRWLNLVFYQLTLSTPELPTEG